MDGRWTLWRVRESGGLQRPGRWWQVDPEQWAENLPGFVTETVPVVPCDEAAIERGINAYVKIQTAVHPGVFFADREVVEAVLRAAGETP